MKKIIYFLVFGFVCSCERHNNPNEKEWVQLFNGKDLSDWQVKISGHDLNDNVGNTFRVEDGIMKVKYDQYDSFRQQFGHIFYKEKFSNYLLAVEYRFTGDQCKGGPDWAKRNSGAMLHSQDPATMLKEQDFPISIEAQLLGGLGEGNRPTANLCTPGTTVHMGDTLFTPHCISSKSKTYEGDQWVRAEFLVLGDSLIRHMVEGETVLEYTRPKIGGGAVSNFDPKVKVDGMPLTEGFIALQSESHPVEFRKVELVNLKGCKDPKAKNYKSYYIRSDNSLCKY
ncbi:MAG: DUF1080 domain-containing protein [Bacteroidetes bacterium]|nr:DUF1080 domain-containing protein [Bacteroidota bacterium]